MGTRGRYKLVPVQGGKAAGWLRLAASSQSGGEWTPNVVDVLNNNPVTQTDTDRRAAVGASGNGLPTMVFDGTDVHVWALDNSINNMATKLGFWIWWKPATVNTIQHLLAIVTASGASANKLDIYANNAQVFCECYISGSDGRFGRTGNVLTAGTSCATYIQYDSSRGGDANLAIFHNGVSQSLTYGDLGAGGTLTVLPQPTGNCLIGAVTNSDTPVQAITNGGLFGPNPIVPFNDNLTAGEIANMMIFEALT